MNFVLDSLHGFCTDRSIVPIKYSMLSAVCTYCTTLLHMYLSSSFAQYVTFLHAYCTVVNLHRTAHLMNPQYCTLFCSIAHYLIDY